MFRYFSAEENINKNKVIVSGGDARHLKTILRAQMGDEITIVTESSEYLASIISLEKDTIECEIKEEIISNNEASINITLCQGIPKQTKMETIIQQNVELGVKTFIPLITQRTVVKLNDKDREQKKLERWQKIAKESAKQSKRNIVPVVLDIMTLKEMINKAKDENATLIVPYELEDTKTLKEVLKDKTKDYYVVIGPEGGFDLSEITMLQESGAKIVTLGKRILRTQTAGVIASSIIIYECDEMK